MFLSHGGHSPYLEHVSTVLRGIRDGVEAGEAMFAAFDAAGLIQPLKLDVQLDDSHRVNVAGLHGIDRERLAALDAQIAARLHRAGYLEGAYLVLSSHAQPAPADGREAAPPAHWRAEDARWHVVDVAAAIRDASNAQRPTRCRWRQLLAVGATGGAARHGGATGSWCRRLRARRSEAMDYLRRYYNGQPVHVLLGRPRWRGVRSTTPISPT